MVARKGRLNRAEKLLIREDGKQFIAQVGMVDHEGVMFNVLDVGNKRLEFHPMSWIVQDVEADNEKLRAETKMHEERAERAVSALRRAVELYDELVMCGGFQKKERQIYRERIWRVKTKLKELIGDGK